MDAQDQRKPGRTLSLQATRKPISMAPSALIQTSYLQPGSRLPLVVQPALAGVDLMLWASTNREFIEAQLHEHGAVLFRGFNVPSVAEFNRFLTTIYGAPMAYRERTSPRSQVEGNIYTSTDYPADQPIFLHNEHSYATTFPLRIAFFCAEPPQQGGETPIADCRKVLARIDPEIRARFAHSGWMYVRNFGDAIGLSWQTVFQTDDKARVEAYCQDAGIAVAWLADNRLRTRQIRPTELRHPHTGEQVWFNHLTFFHISTLPAPLYAELRSQFTAESLPNNTYYGDGSPIEEEVMEHLRAAYLAEKVLFTWQRSDILLLDNILVAHGREPFSGPRKILVGMAVPYQRDDIG